MNVTSFESAQCKRVHAYLDSYLSNELLVETNHEVLKHLQTCDECARFLDDRARIKSQLKRAVLNERAPEALRERIRADIRRTDRPSFNFKPTWMLAAAAAVVLALALGAFFRLGNSNDPRPSALSLNAEVSPEDAASQILKVGFDDHVFCAIDHGMANKHFTAAQMSESLGPEYEGLVTLVKQRMPETCEVLVGHRCHYRQREFVHIIVRAREQIISLIITRKSGEAFPDGGAGAVMQAPGVSMYEASWHQFQVAGTETRDHLMFIVSNGSRRDNEQIAWTLVPALGDFLRKLEA